MLNIHQNLTVTKPTLNSGQHNNEENPDNMKKAASESIAAALATGRDANFNPYINSFSYMST